MARIKKVKLEEPKIEETKIEEPKIESDVVEEPRLEAPVTPEPVAVKADPDYLRQYQYKKVNNVIEVGTVGTNPDQGSKAEVMKKGLLSQPRVGIFIPKAENEDPKIKLSVNLNGYRLDFPKNVYIDVPMQIAEIIRDSLNQQASALIPFQINRDKATNEALS